MHSSLGPRPWLPDAVDGYIGAVAEHASGLAGDVTGEVERLVAASHRIHDETCINLNPATNVMNPRAEAMLSAGLGSRPSLGYPGEKYETGLEAIEQIEIIAADLAAQVFDAVTPRSASGRVRWPTCTRSWPPASPATRSSPRRRRSAATSPTTARCRRPYGLHTIEAPIDAGRYTVDLDALAGLAREVRPKLITVGGSLNLIPHPVAEVREIADEVGARCCSTPRTLCGMIAGRAWPNPLDRGRAPDDDEHLQEPRRAARRTAARRDADLAERIDAIAYPGLTANFDAGKSAALAITLLDWRSSATPTPRHGRHRRRLAEASPCRACRCSPRRRITTSHQFAVEVAGYGGGQAARGRYGGRTCSPAASGCRPGRR